MRALLSHFFSRQFGVFLVVGGIAAVANFASGALTRHLAPAWPIGLGVTIGNVVGTVVSFYLNRRHTFEVHDDAMGPQAARFAIVTLGYMALGFVLSEAALAVWEHAGSPWTTRAQMEGFVHIGVIGVNTIYSYLAMKFFALRERRSA